MKTILSIDGGGIRGYIPAFVLRKIEAIVGYPLHEAFDLVVGTSTGGIIAAGIAVPTIQDSKAPRYNMQDIMDFYEHEAKDIFKKPTCAVGMLFNAKYDTNLLYDKLHQKIGNVPYGQLLTNVMVPCFDMTARRPYFFKSWKKPVELISTDRIVTATCSAPLFFDPTRIDFEDGEEPRYMVDGAVVADNPAMCAYVEARRMWGDEDVFVLSLGCGDTTNPTDPSDKKRWGAASWLPDIMEVLGSGAVNTVDYQMRTIEPDMYVRLNVKIQDANDTLDDVSPKNFDGLKKDAARLILENQRTIYKVATILRDHVDKKRKSC